MSERDTVRARLEPDGRVVQVLADGTVIPLESRADRARLAAMTEAEIEANARNDPDNPPLTAEELARMRPVPNAKAIRRRLQMTQEQFAERFQLPLGTVRDWERGARTPAGPARTLLRVIEHNPSAVIAALGGGDRERPTG